MMTIRSSDTPTSSDARMRIDKWLWAARFFKTRALAVDEIQKGRVQVNGIDCKPAREIRVGDRIAMRQGQMPRTVVVEGLSPQRGPAPVAQQLYRETEESMALRQSIAERNRMAPEPAQAIAHGRPTKRDRRLLEQAREDSGGWGSRWSASLPD